MSWRFRAVAVDGSYAVARGIYVYVYVRFVGSGFVGRFSREVED